MTENERRTESPAYHAILRRLLFILALCLLIAPSAWEIIRMAERHITRVTTRRHSGNCDHSQSKAMPEHSTLLAICITKARA